MSESIAIDLKRSAIALAEELDYQRAGRKLKITSAELRRHIAALEAQLYFHIFEPTQRRVELTKEGEFLIKIFRKSVAQHDRNASKDAGEIE